MVAFNISNLETVQGITKAAEKLKAPIILQVSAGARKYARKEYLLSLFKAAKKSASIPIILHLDHGENFEICKQCIDDGFDSVMIDGSALSFEENIKLTKKVVDYAHKRNVWVEGELGAISGIEDDIGKNSVVCEHNKHYIRDMPYTNPEQAKEFVEKTGVDSLAIAIGTAHGAYKYKTQIKEGECPLRLDILEKIHALIPKTPLVLHGASSVISEYVEIINKFGGEIEGAYGIREEEIAKTIKFGVRKINIDSDLRLGITGIIRKYFDENKSEIDPRKYLGEAREETERIAARKIMCYTLGNEGREGE